MLLLSVSQKAQIGSGPPLSALAAVVASVGELEEGYCLLGRLGLAKRHFGRFQTWNRGCTGSAHSIAQPSQANITELFINISGTSKVIKSSVTPDELGRSKIVNRFARCVDVCVITWFANWLSCFHLAKLGRDRVLPSIARTSLLVVASCPASLHPSLLL